MQQRQQVFSDLALSAGNAFTLTGRGVPEQVIGLHASAALLPTLGLQPIIGRNFSPDEDRRGGPRVVLISQQMWQQRFNGDASVLGQALTLDGAPYTIIGVLPDAATAFRQSPADLGAAAQRGALSRAVAAAGRQLLFQPIARLKPGVSLEQAREAMNVIAAGYRAAHPGTSTHRRRSSSCRSWTMRSARSERVICCSLGAVACVLLIACANIANLLLARFAGRQREIATRLALGAHRGALVRQLVSESMLLAVLGGAVGLLLAEWTLRALVAFGTDVIPRVAEIRIDPIALGFAVIATLVTGLSIGLLPAMQASGVNVLGALKERAQAPSDRAAIFVAAWLSLKSRCRWCC